MWAMIPMFRTRSSPTGVATADISSLPAVVREGLVGLRHPVDVVLLLVRTALLIERVHELTGELRRHALFASIARVLHDPAQRERSRAPLRHLDGHLVVRAADAPGADLEDGRDALDGLLEHLELRLPGLLGRDRERVVHRALGDGLLSVEHEAVDQRRDEHGAMNGIGLDLTWLNLCAAGHRRNLLRLLRAVLRTRLAPLGHTRRVEAAANDLVAKAREVLDAATTNQHDGVLLQVVTLARDVGTDLHAVREPDSRDLAQRGVRLLRRGRVDARADAALLRGSPERRRLRLHLRRCSTFPDELIHCGHAVAPTAGRWLGRRCRGQAQA